MKVLVLNCGSSSLKYQLFEMENESVLANGNVERIGMDDAIHSHKASNLDKHKQVLAIHEHKSAIKAVLNMLIDKKYGVIKDYDEIKAVGHRVVHGGEHFSDSVEINEEVEKEIKSCFELAPLHNPANLLGIDAIKEVLPSVRQVAVFDTAFHQSLEPKAFLYPIPTEQYRKNKVRRYGFHGTSHKYVSKRAIDLYNNVFAAKSDLKIVSCHIGNGASISAIANGCSVDTTMGMTPLEGLMMGTRSGDIDAAAVLYIMQKDELKMQEMSSLLNKHSGLLGVSGISGDMREIEELVEKGHEQAILAFDMYEYRIRKYIGAYAAAMNGIDILLFTAGVGENSDLLRKKICTNLSYLGIIVDEQKNNVRSDEDRIVSSSDSKVAVMVIPTNEELMIARDTVNIIK